ncbi:MAG: helix-turn-helix domain-containing protein [Chitinophagaceae bacterium]|nr:MAG: helix-turn-helix domain-containing protein [Chitinophagaceae bacterium]
MMEVAVIIPRQYKLLSVAALLDVLETVNKNLRSSGKPEAYSLSVVTAGGDARHEQFFRGYQSRTIHDEYEPRLILVPSFTSDDIAETVRSNKEFIPWIVRHHDDGAEIASFCTGAFLLGATGLLDGKAATTHVDACRAFAKSFPEVLLMPDKIVTQDGRIYTSGGSTSTFHLLLHLVQRHCGKDMAIRMAKLFAIDMDRHNQTYFSTFHPSRNHTDDLVATAQQKIEDSYHSSGTIEEMIRDIPSSRRNMVRRFKQVTGVTPIEYLQLTRIEAAKKLLEQTAQQMTEVILNTGYNDPKAFRKVFRKTVGMTPTEYREKFQVR